jgi:hypothetical protein
VLLGGLSGAARAQEVSKVSVEVTVSHASDSEGPIDPRGRKFDEELRKHFVYKSFRVLQTERLRLGMNQTGQVRLPTGSFVRVQPLGVEGDRVLLDVEVENTLRTQLRIQNHHQVLVGAQRYQDGKLVIHLRPDY